MSQAQAAQSFENAIQDLILDLKVVRQPTNTSETPANEKDEKEKPEVNYIKHPSYLHDVDGARAIYMPHEVRNAIYMSDGLEELFNTRDLRQSLNVNENNMRNEVEKKQYRRAFSFPLANLYLNRIKLETLAEEMLGDESEETQQIGAEIKRVLDIIDDTCGTIITKFQAFDKTTKLNFSELSIGLSIPNKIFAQNVGETTIVFKSEKASIQSNMFEGVFIELLGSVYASSKTGLVPTKYKGKIPYFEGEQTAEQIGLVCIDTLGDEQQRYINRGKEFVRITEKPSYMQYKGNVIRKTWYNEHRFKANGRIMVDRGGMEMMDPDYRMYFGKSGYRDDDEDTSVIKNKSYTDEIYMLCSPYIYGFSFAAKQWGEMLIENVSDITFRTDSYEKLVMDEDQKDMIFSLVDTNYVGKCDLIDGKGGGCIFLLAGQPGTGKTLTAEVIAERLKRPLYMVGVGELGTDVDALETSLRNILDIASSWNAVLLIDEADIFMEARSNRDVHRNAMVGVFLRLLEYYEGVLFLTTNRAKNIDKAFFFRISMAIHFPDLGYDDRYTIWTNILNLYNVNSLSKADIEELAKYELNGRQIKGITRIASGLAGSESREVDYDDILRVIEKSEEFTEYMKGDVDVHVAFDKKDIPVQIQPVMEQPPTLFQRVKKAVLAFFE